jgi:Mg-chelatase subunit ChlI
MPDHHGPPENEINEQLLQLFYPMFKQTHTEDIGMRIRAMPCLVPSQQLLGNVSIPAFKDSLEHHFNLNKT